jgi:hypothetical protein
MATRMNEVGQEEQEAMDELLSLFHETSPYEGFDPSAHPADMQGWGSVDPIFAEVIGAVKPKIIVEVGSWKGASAINMAKIAKSLGVDCKIICIDTWLGSPEHFLGNDPSWRTSLRLTHGYPQLYFTFLANVVRNGVQDVIVPLASTSESAAVILERKRVRPDVVYIDAAHEYEPVLRDLRLYWKLLADDGVLVGDDYIGWAGVTRAANEFAAELKTQIFGKPGKFVISKGKAWNIRIAVT